MQETSTIKEDNHFVIISLLLKIYNFCLIVNIIMIVLLICAFALDTWLNVGE